MNRLRAALLSASLVVSAAAQAGDAVTPERLRSDLEQGAALFRRKPDPVAAADYAAALEYVDVAFEGETIAVRDPWLADAVEGLPELNKENRRERLDAIAAHLAGRASQVDAAFPGDPIAMASGTPRPPAPEDPKALLDGILDQQQYHAPQEDPKLARAAAKLRDRVRSAWTSFKEFISGLFDGKQQDESWWGTAKRIAVLVLAVAGLLVLFWLVARTILRAAVDAAADAPDAELPDAPPAPAVMAAEAERLAQIGDLRGAVRALYLALLGRLHREGAIVYDRHRTNREYLRTMRASRERAIAFAAVVEFFDRKWYGREDCTREEVALFESETLRASPSTVPGERAA